MKPLRHRSLGRLVYVASVFSTAWLSSSEVHAQTVYAVRSGKIAFNVGSNIPFVKVTGSSTAVSGGGEATIAENTAAIRNLHFEVDPVTFKTGINLRDEHLYEKVFTASNGSRPKIVLRVDRLVAKLDPKTSRWEGTLQAQLSMRGVTRPVSFHVSSEKSDRGARVTAEGVVKTSDFGVKPISNAGVTVRDEVSVTVSNLALEP